MKYLIPLLLLGSSLLGVEYSVDPSCRSFELRQPVKQRIDTFSFEGEYPELENIDIDATRKKHVEFYLTGDYPALERIDYEGNFGQLMVEVTGTFPKLSLINFLTQNCAMNVDLTAPWQQSCEINIRGGKKDIIVLLPKDIGLIIHTTTAAKGKVIPCEGLAKKKLFGFFNKTFENEQAHTAPICLTLKITLTEGSIILK
jgi:hypothetical protein